MGSCKTLILDLRCRAHYKNKVETHLLHLELESKEKCCQGHSKLRFFTIGPRLFKFFHLETEAVTQQQAEGGLTPWKLWDDGWQTFYFLL